MDIESIWNTILTVIKKASNEALEKKRKILARRKVYRFGARRAASIREKEES